jgi:hypothetical protein
MYVEFSEQFFVLILAEHVYPSRPSIHLQCIQSPIPGFQTPGDQTVNKRFSLYYHESAERILECNDDQLSDCPVKGGKIYSEIIRVWDIVFDHDKINSSVQKIVKSHTRKSTLISMFCRM